MGQCTIRCPTGPAPPIEEYYGLDVGVDREHGTTSLSACGYIERMQAKLKLTTVPAWVQTPWVVLSSSLVG